MDVLEPETIWVNNRRYRFFDSNVWSSEQKMTPYQEEYQSELDDLTNEACENEEIFIESIEGGRYKHIIDINKAFYGGIIGHQGQTIRKLQQETRTTIKVPKNTQDVITIIGTTRGDVISARQRIDLLVENSRKRMPPSHFISIPLKDEQMKNNYENFKQQILNDPDYQNSGILEEMFTNPSKLHLTIGMMLLVGEEEVRKAVGVLKNCVDEVIRPILKDSKNPIRIKIQGLDCMNDDPTRVSVLYGSVEKNEVLQGIVNKVFGYFLERGLTRVEYTENIKLHMTVIKSSKVIPKDQRRRGGKRIFFNASNILQKFEKFNFGEVTLDTIEICDRNVEQEDGSYGTIETIKL